MYGIPYLYIIDKFLHNFLNKIYNNIIKIYCNPVLCCRQCMKLFKSRLELVNHKNNACIPSIERSNDIKTQKDIQKSLEKNHKHLENQLFCEYNGCGKYFKDKRTYNRHIKRHTKPYKCNVNGCLRTFGSKWDLKIHKRIHENQKIEVCSYCGIKFVDPNTLRRHIQSYHITSQKQYMCKICKTPFKRKETLQIHLKSKHG